MHQNASKSKSPRTRVKYNFANHVASLEKPLLGAVLCCTAIATEDRTRLAEYAESMGAEHKLDLTSDVTHLLVGSTDTPKYQYVAKERDDVSVLRPEWVEAVRKCWMEDRPINMNALQAEYRVPTLAGLKICITGFDDLTFRGQLQKNVVSNGGEYTGDLTKDVTHLIAAKPEGKKYEYATLWQKKVVSLQWYKDTLDRGMQLDESKYHPTRSADEQGVGAWNRNDRGQPNTAKRAREEQPAQEPTRKLRRVASARLGSQTENMWGDITGQVSLQSATNQGGLRSMKSLPSIGDTGKPSSVEVHPIQPKNDATANPGFLNGLVFAVANFEKRKDVLIRKTLQAAGATIVTSLAELLANQNTERGPQYIILPHETRQKELPFGGSACFIVSELWLERCILQKGWIHPSQYPLGGLITTIESPQIKSVKMNATGFQPIETLHISKTVALTGATYAETFNQECTVLVCNSMNINRQKVFHAKQWGIPAVSERWLCKLLVDGSMPTFDTYLIGGDDDDSNDLEDELKQKRLGWNNQHPLDYHANHSATKSSSSSDRTASKSFTAYAEPKPSAKSQGSRSTGSSRTQSQQRIAQDKPQNTALREISPNSPSGRSQLHGSPPKKPTFRSFDGANSGTENTFKERSNQTTDDPRKISSPGKYTQDAASINSAIEDLLNMKARAKKNKPNDQSEQQDKKNRLLSRALSNLSNASNGSRHSRASSIDSLNTDGIGSEIPPPSARGNNAGNSCTKPQREGAQSRLHSGTSSTIAAADSMYQTAPMEHPDPYLLLENLETEEIAPQMTQLGYEDSEEAIALREKLAAKRRARNKSENHGVTPESEVEAREREATKQKEKHRQVIKDDETLVASGWGGGRRTRAKNRSREANDLEIL